MNSENFVYWLQGFFELTEGNGLTAKQVRIIKDHLALVLTKVTPDRTVEKDASVPTLEEIIEHVLKNNKRSEPRPSGPYSQYNPVIPDQWQLYCSAITATKEPKIPDTRPDFSSIESKAYSND